MQLRRAAPRIFVIFSFVFYYSNYSSLCRIQIHYH